MNRNKYFICSLLVLVIVLLSFFPFSTFSVEQKISPIIQQEILAGSEEIEILIYLDKQLDTSKVAHQVQQQLRVTGNPVNNKHEVRRAVANSLINNADKSQASLIGFLNKKSEAGKAGNIEGFFIINMIYAVVAPDLVAEIAARRDVKYIYANETIKLDNPLTVDDLFVQEDGAVSWNLKHIGAQDAWFKYEIDGEGVVIGIIDTGVDWEHPALKNNWRGFAEGEVLPDYNWFDTVNNSMMPSDENGHGTSVIGIALGRDLDNNQYIGVAPGAKWIACQGLSSSGSGNKQSLIKAGQFMLAPTDLEGNNPDPDMAPDVIIGSWGGNLGEDDWYWEMIENWRNAQIFSVFAAGNTGPKVGSVHNPANYAISFAVGAIDSFNSIASFSSRGPSVYGEMIKPELVAPGVQVLTSIAGDAYGYINGTSMAAPHVAGTVALLLSLEPSLRIEELEEILKDTATPLVDNNYPASPNYAFGYGLVNPLLALDSLVSEHHRVAILVNGQGNTAPVPGIYVVPDGNVFTVEAVADPKWAFKKWVVDEVEYTEDFLTVLIEEDLEIEAFFAEIEDDYSWSIIESPVEPIALDELWLITFNRSFSTSEIDGMVIEYEDRFIAVDIVLKELDGQAIVTPVEPYLPGETYTLKIFLNNFNRYKMEFQTVSP